MVGSASARARRTIKARRIVKVKVCLFSPIPRVLYTSDEYLTVAYFFWEKRSPLLMEYFLKGDPKNSKMLLPYTHEISREGPINYLQKAYRNLSDVIISLENKS